MILAMHSVKILMIKPNGGIKMMFASSKNSAMATGIGVGLAVGVATAMCTAKMMSCSGKRAYKRKAAKCMRTVEDVMDNITSMMR